MVSNFGCLQACRRNWVGQGGLADGGHESALLIVLVCCSHRVVAPLPRTRATHSGAPCGLSGRHVHPSCLGDGQVNRFARMSSGSIAM